MPKAATLDRPLYSIGEAARLLKLPSKTLRRWLEGETRSGVFYEPVIRSEPSGRDIVTWAEFVEAGFLGGYREHGVRLQRMRPFIEATRAQLGVPYPLAHFKPLIDHGELVYELQVKTALEPELYLVRPAAGGQMQWAEPVREFLKKVEFANDSSLVARIYPLGKRKPVVIDPEISFGIPQIRGVRTELVAESLAAGEQPEEAARSWGLKISDVLAAASWEQALPRAA